MSYRRVSSDGAIFVKELHHITRDARSLGMALAVPVMMLLLYGYALSLDVDRMPTLIYDQDQTPAEPRADPAVSGVALLRSPRLRRRTTPAIEQAIDRNRILMGVVIPRDYSQKTRRPAARRRCNFCWTAAIRIPRRSRWGMRRTWCAATRWQTADAGDEPARRRAAWRRRSMRGCASGTTARSNRRTTWCRD